MEAGPPPSSMTQADATTDKCTKIKSSSVNMYVTHHTIQLTSCPEIMLSSPGNGVPNLLPFPFPVLHRSYTTFYFLSLICFDLMLISFLTPQTLRDMERE